MGPASICRACLRVRDDGTCDAFPDGIPARIAFQHFDHRVAFPGDAGIRFLLDPSNADLLDGYETVSRFLEELLASA